MTTDEFLLTKPCLEEITGFLQGLPGMPNVVSTEDRDKIDAYRERLLEGKVVPSPSYLPRAYIYRVGRRPAVRK